MEKKNKILQPLLMALMAMSIFNTNSTLGQTKKDSGKKILTPDTSKELAPSTSFEKKSSKKSEIPENNSDEKVKLKSPSVSRLQRHGAGLGLGQTFLLGNYSKYGSDKITLDFLYTYAASYSFDLLVNAHFSEHKNQNERMRLNGLNGAIKARFVEYDQLAPYFLGGLGFYAPRAKKSSESGTEWTDQKITFGLNFGGGLDLRLNDHYLVGLMGQLHWPFKVEQDNHSDLKGYYFKLLITGIYLF